MRIIFVTAILLLSLNIDCFAQQNSLQIFPLCDVRLLNSPFKQAQETDKKYILSMDVDRLLAPFLKEAGIETKAISYPNWENSGLDGHIGGHYLSALANMYAATGDAEVLRRLTYMINQLEKCQQKDANGYVGGIPGGKKMWQDVAAGKINAGGFSLNDKWVPLYNIHKLYAGLIDAYTIAGNQKAKTILVQLSDWFYIITSKLSDEQLQTILRSEHGGMNEAFADVAAITGDKKYLEMAKRLTHKIILNPLLQQKDALNGLHANTQIPKVIGFVRIASLGGDSSWAGSGGGNGEADGVVQQWWEAERSAALGLPPGAGSKDEAGAYEDSRDVLTGGSCVHCLRQRQRRRTRECMLLGCQVASDSMRGRRAVWEPHAACRGIPPLGPGLMQGWPVLHPSPPAARPHPRHSPSCSLHAACCAPPPHCRLQAAR